MASRCFGRLVCVSLLLGCCSHRNFPITDHYDGREFFNPWTVKAEQKNFWDFLKWQWQGMREPWPEWSPDIETPELGTPEHTAEVRLTLINHASYLLQFASFNMLSDPVFSERVSPLPFLGPKRHRPVGLAFDQLPKIDYVILSHNHYDHLDLDSLERLDKQHSPLFFVPLGNRELLATRGIERVVELDWWQSYQLQDKTRLHMVPAQHWSARGVLDRNKALWGAYVVESGLLKVFFAGDTGYGPHFKEIYQRFGPMQASLLPIGAYEPRWFMKEQHMNPEEAVQAHLDLASETSLGMHYGTFQLTDEGRDRPLEQLTESLKAAAIASERFLAPKNGQTHAISFTRSASSQLIP